MNTDDLELTGGRWVPTGHSTVRWQWDSAELAELSTVAVGEQYELDLGVAS